MKILHLVNHCRLGHGNVHLAVDLAAVQAAHGHDVTFASEGGEFLDLLAGAGVRHIPLVQRSRRPVQLAHSLLRLVHLVRQDKYDIVHAHMMAGAFLGYLATRLTHARLVTTVHNSFDRHSIIMKLGDRIVAVSEAERRTLIARGFPERKLTTIVNAPLGGHRVRFVAVGVPGEMPGVQATGRVITTVCGLHARKGVDTVIAAFARLAGHQVTAELHIVGDGPDRQMLEAQAAATGFGDRIRFHGSLRDPQAVLRKSDIFVLASHAEPIGLVNIEARAAGCAIVASNVGGIPEALDDGMAGILVDPSDVGAFAAAFDRLLTDDNLLAEMKRRAASGLERFSIERLYRDHFALYDDLMRRPAPAMGPSPASEV